MKRFTLRRRLLAAAFGFATIIPVSALAQDSQPIKILVGASAGGTTDTLARALAKLMEPTLKRTIIVENKPGAGGNIAAEAVAHSNPDGNTVLMSFTSHTINPSLFKRMPFDTVKDFTPLAMVAQVPSVLIASSTIPQNNLGEVIAHAKKNPGQLNFAIGGLGSSLHMASEQFKMRAGLDIASVPYKGTAPAISDVLAGHIQLMFASTVNVRPHMNGGKIKILGVTSKEAMPQFPNVPPIAQTVPGFESEAWFGLFGPANMPKATVDRLYDAINKAMSTEEFKKRLAVDGGRPGSMTPEQFAKFIPEDIARWAQVVKFSGATAQ